MPWNPAIEPTPSARGARRWGIEPLEDRLPLHGESLAATGSISGWAFVDAVRDLRYDASESPVAGLTIELRDADGNLVAAVATDESGRFEFDDLPAGVYSLYRDEFAVENLLDGGQRVGHAGGDALVDQAIVEIALAAGENADDYVFTAVERFESPSPLPDPILHGVARDRALAALVLATPRSGFGPIAEQPRAEDAAESPTNAPTPLATVADTAPITETVSASGSVLAGQDDEGIVVARMENAFRAAVRRRAGDSSIALWRRFDPRRDLFDDPRRFRGDADGDGQAEEIAFQSGKWWVDRDRDGQPSAPDLVAASGDPQGTPAVGDLDRDGQDELIVVPKRIVDAALDAPRHEAFAFLGDWTGHDRPSIGLATEGRWWLDLDGDLQPSDRDRFGQGMVARFAAPIVADFDGDGADEPNWPGPSHVDAASGDQVFASPEGTDAVARVAEWIDRALRLLGG